MKHIVFLAGIALLAVFPFQNSAQNFRLSQKANFCSASDVTSKNILFLTEKNDPAQEKNSLFKTKGRRDLLKVLSRDEENAHKLFFQQSVGVAILSAGEIASGTAGLDLVCAGVYYAPKLAYKIGKSASLCFGTNIQTVVNADNILLLSLPLTVGASIGSGATHDKENRMPVGAFANIGVGTAVLLDDDDDTFIIGPTMDFGFRVYRIELRFSLLKNIDSDVFIAGAGLGYCF